MTNLTIGLIGSTQHTLLASQFLLPQHGCQISWVMTPSPRPIGRHQVLTPNPVHRWADSHRLPTFLIDQKILPQLADQLDQQPRPDFILVVDFGYLIPDWLINYPKQKILNLHPSALPSWRGSTPAQLAILTGDTHSAITLMELTARLDQGPILAQLPLAINPTWTSAEYYQAAFSLIAPQLPTFLAKIANHQLPAQPQPLASPTPLARRLTKIDSWVSWSVIKYLTSTATTQPPAAAEILAELSTVATATSTKLTTNQSPLLTHQILHTSPTDWPALILRAIRAFTPWPKLWTIMPTQTGPKNLQILAGQLNSPKIASHNSPRLQLTKVQLAGGQPATWAQIKNNLQV